MPEPEVLWLKALSDGAIGLACLTISFALITMMRYRPDLNRRSVFGLFAAFILLSGFGHGLNLLNLWVPAYAILGPVKAMLALASVATAIVAWKLVPQLLAQPAPAQHRKIKIDSFEVRQPERHMTVAAKEAGDDRGELTGERGRGGAAGQMADAVYRRDGTLPGSVTATCDITRQRIDDEQREIIVEASPNGIMIVTEEGLITFANNQVEWIFDYPRGALVGRSLEILLPQEFQNVCNAFRSAVSSANRVGFTPPSQPRQFAGCKRDGSEVIIEVMLNPVTTPRGRIVVAAIIDVTDRVRLAVEQQEADRRERLAAAETNSKLDHLTHHLAEARDRAEHANQAKSRFLAAITHELRTPLHGILGYAELMNLEGGLSPTQTERLAVMMASGHHLLGTVNAVLDMSQIEADQLQLLSVEVDLPSLIRVCLDVIRPAAEAKGLALVAAPSAPLRLFADPTRLRQVLINLIGNAVKFTPSGSVEVRFGPTEAGAYIRLEVADSGPGIRAIHRSKLFQTFERLNAEAVSGIEGTGLGLAIAARLVQLMGGRIGHEDNPGGGSVFWIELPASSAASSTAPESVRPPSVAETSKLRVLVVDDEPLNRSIASAFLSFAGHEVVCVDNGQAGVEAAATDNFDVILMDVRMPGMNGLEATRRIRALPAPRGQVRVVAVTAQAFAEQIEMCRKAGMDAHVSKPFEPQVLLDALRNPPIQPGGPDAATRPAVTACGEGPDTPLFDRTLFEDTTELLPQVELRQHMQTLVTRCEKLLRELRHPDLLARARELLEDTHRLAGSAGTFGFLFVAAAARQFEHAAETGAAETQAFADRLITAIDASMPTIQQELEATVVVEQ